MKRITRSVLAIFLATLMGVLPTVRVLEAKADSPDYISEVKIFMDLNKDAGKAQTNPLVPGGKGNKAVYLGYKTTKNRDEAITDLALMNMKGGYDVNEYEILMEKQLKSQIKPFVESFVNALAEYRTNYDSANAANKARARYIHDVLNKLTDDDTGKPLGDLLLKETKFELGDAAYNALSAEEKKEHADIVTIIAQANGRATLLLENLIARAADTSDDTWLDRFAKMTYEDLEEATGLTPSDAEKYLAKQYDDNAYAILEMWDAFREELLGYDDAVKVIAGYDKDAVNAAIEAFGNITDKTSEKEKTRITEEYENAGTQIAAVTKATKTVAIHDKLAGIKYLDGTMLDFFLQEREELEDDITLLYPLAAAFSKGQLAGLEFISLKELMNIAIASEEGYSDDTLRDLKAASIYEGVDRGIYEKGGVALTTEARRKSAQAYQDPESPNSDLYRVMLYVSLGLGAAAAIAGITALKLYMFAQRAEYVYANQVYEVFDKAVSAAWRTSRIATYMTAGLTVACGIMALVTIAINAKEMAEYYNVKFTPIPHYMVDEKDLIGYNKKGEKIVLKNQTAYYKAVQCNRTSADEMFTSIDTCADMNGDVGSQWLALYYVKYDIMEPILASSLKAVVGKADIPNSYTSGIHMFGSDAAFNLNSSLYDWNNDAPAIYVYFKTDDQAARTAGANFTAGTIALSGAAGLAIGAVVTALIMKKKKNDPVQA